MIFEAPNLFILNGAQVLVPKYPSVKVQDCGIIRLKNQDYLCLAISPDGVATVLTPSGDLKRIALEFKTPAQIKRSDPNQKGCRPMYILQVHAEMVALEADEAYLVSWGPVITRVYHIKFDAELWGLVEKWLTESRAEDFVLPGKMPDICVEIMKRCEQIAKKATEDRNPPVNSVHASRGSG